MKQLTSNDVTGESGDGGDQTDVIVDEIFVAGGRTVDVRTVP